MTPARSPSPVHHLAKRIARTIQKENLVSGRTVCDDICESMFDVMTRKDGLIAAHSFVTQIDTIWESVRWSRSPSRASSSSPSTVQIRSVTSSCGDATKCIDGLSSTCWEAGDLNEKERKSNDSLVFRLKQICSLSSMAVQFGDVYGSKWTVECAVMSHTDDENSVKWHYVAYNSTGEPDWSWAEIPLRDVGVNAVRLTILKWSGSLKMKTKEGKTHRQKGLIRDVALYVFFFLSLPPLSLSLLSLSLSLSLYLYLSLYSLGFI